MTTATVLETPVDKHGIPLELAENLAIIRQYPHVKVSVQRLKLIIARDFQALPNFNPDYGVCFNAALPQCLVVYFEYWPHSRGPLVAPIEGDYELYSENQRKYDGRTEFGRKRFLLAQWLVNVFDEQED